jgi:excisionase family DNA binding protein
MSRPEYLSVDEVAAIFRKHRDTIRIWCRTGKLKGARKIGRDWFIPYSAVAYDSDQSPKKAEAGGL